jgi:MFS transporter, MHS family, proline/betaine transporter
VTAASNIPVNPRAAGGTRAILAASVGNVLEWYDFSVYALFAIYIAANFFPHGNHGADLVSAFLLFGLGFVIRPVGAVVVGIYGDRAGRKAALTATILIMGCGTLILAIAPSYASVGILAAWILLAGRLLQGFSAGGEIGSAAAFLVEHAPLERKGLFAAWLQASMGMSNILGALVAFAITALMPRSEIIRWAWRLPFFIGLAIVPLGLYLRRTLEETPAFRAEFSLERVTRAPLKSVLREYPRSLVTGFGISILWAVTVYVLLIYMPVYLQRAFRFTATEAFGASLVENVVFVISCFGFGALADRIGHAKVQAYGAAALLVAVVPLFSWLAHFPDSVTVLVLVMSCCGVMVASFTSVAPTVLAGLFPTRVRATGVSLVYNAAFTIFGAFAPAILTWLTINMPGSLLAPAWCVALAAVPALLANPLQTWARSAPLEVPARDT